MSLSELLSVPRATACAMGLLLVIATGCADDQTITAPSAFPEEASANQGRSDLERRTLRVMSRNLYLGGDIGPILSASDPNEIPLLVAQTWAMVQASDFPERARLIVREIARSQPHVIGLQEVALFRTQSPGDFLIGNPQPAQHVAIDFLEIIVEELARRGVHYEVATVVENIDVELPSATSPTTFDDVRFTDRDVVLVRRGTTIEAASSGSYAVNLAFPVAGTVPITILRGWNRVDVLHRGERYHFVNTHLETDESGPQVQELQAQELIAMLAGVDVPTIIVGDLNDTPLGGTGTYDLLTSAGFSDLWVLAHPRGHPEGFTCCFDPDLMGGELFERIDYVLARSTIGSRPIVEGIRTVGAGPAPRTLSGLRPSDHAGLVSGIRFGQMHASDRAFPTPAVP